MNRIFFMRNRSSFEKTFLLLTMTCMILVVPFSYLLSSDLYIRMNEGFITLNLTPSQVLFFGIFSFFIFLIFGGKKDLPIISDEASKSNSKKNR